MEGLHGLPMYGVGGAAVLALAFAAYKSAWVGKQDSGTEKMTKIGGHIADGAMAFLSREYKVLAIFVAVVAGLLAWSNSGMADSHALIALSFVVGAVCSGLAGFFGMRIATKANYRTTAAAQPA